MRTSYNLSFPFIQRSVSYSIEEKMWLIRFFSICSIVWGHCLLSWDARHVVQPQFEWYKVIFLQLGKIGTINFFIITGYFLNSKIQSLSIWGYFKYRFYPLILPWIIFLIIFVFVETFKVLTIHQLETQSLFSLVQLSARLAGSFIFHSAYWFIPISILSALTLILFKRFVIQYWFGLILALITLFYCFNLYNGWIATNHTKSIFGYIFFMWLGFYIKSKYSLFIDLLKIVHWQLIVALLFATYFLACEEGVLLAKIGSDDPFASIRLSNILFTILLFVSILKLRIPKKIDAFKPERFCYGIYLVHCIIIAQFTSILNEIEHHYFFTNSFFNALILRLSFFSVIMSLSILSVGLIGLTRFKFIFGLK